MSTELLFLLFELPFGEAKCSGNDHKGAALLKL